MLVIGEQINGMFGRIGKAIADKDSAFIRKAALSQVEAGATALDINCGPASKDPATDMAWLVETVQSATDKLLVLDASKPAVIEAGLRAAGTRCLINSATADRNKLGTYLTLAGNYKSMLVVLTVDSSGMPQGCAQRVELAAGIVDFCAQRGFPLEDIYLDPVLMPVSAAQNQVPAALEAIREFKFISPQLKSVLGLSNVSQSAPGRELLNRVYLSMALAAGLDAVILDPSDRALMETLTVAEMLLNRNIYCDSYLKHCPGR